MPFQLFLDDNFHYADESARVPLGVYNTLAEAVSKAVEVVDDYLKSGNARHVHECFHVRPDVQRTHVECEQWAHSWSRGRRRELTKQ